MPPVKCLSFVAAVFKQQITERTALVGSAYLPCSTVPIVAIVVLITQGVSYVKGCHYMYKLLLLKLTDSTHIR